MFCIKYLKDQNEIAGIFFLILFHLLGNLFMFLVNLSDPGIIPKIVTDK